ncbi:hypothetical protein [Amycolatopsis thermoflava]|uniref:hypothetical protein n=1 Tax=Amycolatopsis thermoflava TaxID=84480 RepID=UPI003D717642
MSAFRSSSEGGSQQMIDLVRPALCITGAGNLEFGRSLAAVAGFIVREVAELRALGEFPECATVRVDVAADSRRLDIRIDGLSPDQDPDRVATLAALRAVFEIGSQANLVDVTTAAAPLFTHRILAVGRDGVPYAGLIGAGVGDLHPVVTGQR